MTKDREKLIEEQKRRREEEWKRIDRIYREFQRKERRRAKERQGKEDRKDLFLEKFRRNIQKRHAELSKRFLSGRPINVKALEKLQKDIDLYNKLARQRGGRTLRDVIQQRQRQQQSGREIGRER